MDVKPRLVKLMIDYLYQLEYDDAPKAENMDEATPNGSKEPESPVAQGVKYFETLASTNNPPLSEEAVTIEPVAFEPKSEEPTPAVPTVESELFFQSKTSGEKKQKSIRHDEEPSEQVVQHVEKSNLTLGNEADNLDSTGLTTNALMYALADKYRIDDLKELSRLKFAKAAAIRWQSREFVSAVQIICETTSKADMGLRNVVANTVNAHRELMDNKEIQKLFDSGNGLAWELVKVIYRQQDDVSQVDHVFEEKPNFW